MTMTTLKTNAPAPRLQTQPNIGVVASRVALVDENGSACGENFAPIPSNEIPATLLFTNCLALSSVTARRDVLQPFEPAFAPAEDYELWTRLAGATEFLIRPEPLIRYRIHSGGVSARQPQQMLSAVAAIHAAQLAKLGICEVSPIHALLSVWSLRPTHTQLAEAESWLRSLVDANSETAIHPLLVFRRVVAARWFQVCLDSWSLGWPVWKIYNASPLAQPTLMQSVHLLRRLLPQRLRK